MNTLATSKYLSEQHLNIDTFSNCGSVSSQNIRALLTLSICFFILIEFKLYRMNAIKIKWLVYIMDEKFCYQIIAVCKSQSKSNIPPHQFAMNFEAMFCCAFEQGSCIKFRNRRSTFNNITFCFGVAQKDESYINAAVVAFIPIFILKLNESSFLESEFPAMRAALRNNIHSLAQFIDLLLNELVNLPFFAEIIRL